MLPLNRNFLQLTVAQENVPDRNLIWLTTGWEVFLQDCGLLGRDEVRLEQVLGLVILVKHLMDCLQ